MQLNELSLIQYALSLPLAAAFLAAIIPYRNFRDSITIIISAALIFFVYKICGYVLSGSPALEWRVFEIIPGLAIYFKIEALGSIFAAILAVLWLVSMVYSVGYMRTNNEGNLCRFFAFFSVSIFAALGIAFSGNLLTLFIFYELLTFSTYPLVTHNRTDKTKKAGRVYLGVLVSTSVLFFLPAIILTYNVAGTLDFMPAGIITDKLPPIATMILLGLFIFGIAKTAIMPVHKWLPAAMVAPTPVSALLHAVAVVKAGVFTVVKLVTYIFGIDNLAKIAAEVGEYGNWLTYIASFTIILASVIALTKDSIKLRLAYSTVSQLAYVLLAIGLFSYKGMIAATFQIVAHAFAKFVMFACAGAIYTVSHKRKISEMSGIGRSMPITMACFSIAAISLIGLPPTAGFFAKWYLFDGAIGAEEFFIVGVIAVSTMLNAAYFLPIIHKAFFEREKAPDGISISKKHGEAPLLMVISICAATFVVILLFVYPDKFLDLIGMIGK